MREKSRQKILAAALKLFAEKGYATTSIDDVVRSARVSKGSAYHYFTSKDALLQAVVLDGLRALGSLMERVETEQSPNGKLAALINISFEMLGADTKVWKLYFSLLTQTTLPRSVRKVLEAVIEQMFVHMEKLFKDIGTQDPGGESKMLAAMLDGVFLHYLLVGSAYPLDDMRRKILSRYI